jgi:hypothetical protein
MLNSRTSQRFTSPMISLHTCAVFGLRQFGGYAVLFDWHFPAKPWSIFLKFESHTTSPQPKLSSFKKRNYHCWWIIDRRF